MSAETITLKIPVFIDGEQVSKLTYDTDAISTDQFIDAELRAAAKATARGKMAAQVAELDAGFHVYLGIMAVVAANPGYTVEDVERVQGPDIMKLMKVGRNFMTAGSEGDDDEDSPEPAETAEGVASSDGVYLMAQE